MLTTDEYGVVVNTPETYAGLAEDLIDPDAQACVFRWADGRDEYVHLAAEPGDHSGADLSAPSHVGVKCKGLLMSSPSTPTCTPTMSQRSWTWPGGSAEPLADLLNGVLDEFILELGTPVKETQSQ